MRQIYYSKSCTKVKKRSSYTISYVASDGTRKVGMIVYFMKVLLADLKRTYAVSTSNYNKLI